MSDKRFLSFLAELLILLHFMLVDFDKVIELFDMIRGFDSHHVLFLLSFCTTPYPSKTKDFFLFAYGFV